MDLSKLTVQSLFPPAEEPIIRPSLAVIRNQPPLRPTWRETSHPDLNAFTNYFIAGAAAVPARISAHAFSVIRIRAETGVPGFKMGPSQSLLWMFKTGEGFKGFFKALPISAVKSFPFVGIQFGVYDILHKEFVPVIPDNKPDISASAAIYISGGIAGSVAQALLHPIDVIKTRMIVQGILTKPAYENEIDCLRKILARDGVFGLYRGFLPSVMGAYVFSAQMFMGWDFLHRMPWRRRDKPLFWFESLLFPITAVATASFASMPFDVVRRKMMAYDSSLPKNGRCDVIADTLTNAIVNNYKMNGIPGFFHGFFATAMKIVPQLGVFWLAYKIMQMSALTATGSSKKTDDESKKEAVKMAAVGSEDKKEAVKMAKIEDKKEPIKAAKIEDDKKEPVKTAKIEDDKKEPAKEAGIGDDKKAAKTTE